MSGQGDKMHRPSADPTAEGADVDLPEYPDLLDEDLPPFGEDSTGAPTLRAQ